MKCDYHLATAAILGLTGVVLGASGAHALRPRLEEASMVDAWETAVLYHLVHAVGLTGLALSARLRPLGRAGTIASVCWVSGTILFCGSLYLLSLGAPPRLLGPVTPAGGLFFMAGWLALLSMALAGVKRS